MTTVKTIILIITILNGKMGMIDQYGDNIIPFEYEKISYLIDGRCVATKMVEIDGEEVKRQGMLNSKGEIVLPFVYEELLNFIDGITVAKIEGKWCYINTNGDILFKSDYDRIGHFDGGVAWVSKNGKTGYINKSFVEIFPPMYRSGTVFFGDYAKVEDVNKKQVLVNSKGEVVYESEEGYNIFIGASHKGYFSVFDNYKIPHSMLLDMDGNKIFEGNYYNLYHYVFGDTIAIHGGHEENAVGDLILYNIGNRTATIKNYNYIRHAHQGYYIIGEIVDGIMKYGMVDYKGEVMIESEYEELAFIYRNKRDSLFNDGLCLAKQNGKYGIVSKMGDVILPCKYSNKIRYLGNGIFRDYIHEGSALFDYNGNEIFESDEIWIGSRLKNSEDEYFAKTKEDKFGIFNLKNKSWSLEPIYGHMRFYYQEN